MVQAQGCWSNLKKADVMRKKAGILWSKNQRCSKKRPGGVAGPVDSQAGKSKAAVVLTLAQH
jgi:hypothetical protein